MLIGEIEAEPVREGRFCHQLTFSPNSNVLFYVSIARQEMFVSLLDVRRSCPDAVVFSCPPPPSGSSSPLARYDRWGATGATGERPLWFLFFEEYLVDLETA